MALSCFRTANANSGQSGRWLAANDLMCEQNVFVETSAHRILYYISTVGFSISKLWCYVMYKMKMGPL